MNKKLRTTVISLLLLCSCETHVVNEEKKNEEESNCKFGISKEILESSNVTTLGLKLGLEKENNELDKVMADTTASCDSLQKTWDNFKKLVFEKSGPHPTSDN